MLLPIIFDKQTLAIIQNIVDKFSKFSTYIMLMFNAFTLYIYLFIFFFKLFRICCTNVRHYLRIDLQIHVVVRYDLIKTSLTK